jgi:hypothetical protein
MILGVSLRMLPGFYGLPRVPERRAWWALGVLSASVAAEAAVFLAYRWTGSHAVATAILPVRVGLTAAVLMVVLPWRLWRPMPEPERTGKFVRAAYAWLGVSLLMMLLMPAYHRLAGLGFSHAYFGATRHAITVGFVSLMIMGVAARVVPTLNGVDPGALSGLSGPFLLLNLGCLLRVTMQVATDWTPRAFAPIGLSGTLEVTGLAWWGLGLVAVIVRGRRAAREATRADAPRPARIVAEHRVADVLDWFPGTLPVFLRQGFTALNSAALRQTLARRVTLAQAARLRHVDLPTLLDELNVQARVASTRLTVLSERPVSRDSKGDVR